MGTTAEKLKYLNETKAEIKNALETPYNVMRDYPELIKKYIDNQPTKVVTDGICGNAVDVPVKAIETNGNIRQETTEGYNLLNVPEVLEISIFKEIEVNLEANNTYTFKFDNAIAGSDNNISRIAFRNTTDVVVKNLNTSTVKNFEIQPTQDITNIRIYSSTDYSSSVGKTKTFQKLMIYEGAEDKPYEPYTGGIPSPNLGYTQKITSVGGYDNIFDKNNIISGSYVSDSKGAFTANSTSKRTDYIEIQANSYYYIYSDKTSGNWGAWYDKDKKFISGITLGGQKEGVVNSPANAKYIAFTISYQGNLTDYSNIKINETAIKIKQSGKNWFDNTLKGYGHYGTIAKTIPTGVRLSVNKDVTASDYIYGVFATINLSNYVGKTVRMKATIKSNSNLKGKYTIGLCNSNGTNRKPKEETATSEKIISFVVPDLVPEQEYLCIWFYCNNGGSGVVGDYVDYTNVIITIDNEDMTYEPYHEPIITPINLQGNILSKVRDVKDILKINRNGEVEIKKNVGKVTFVGDDTYAWNISNSSITGLNAFWILISKYKQLNWKQKAQTKLSNYFKYYKEEWKQVTEPCICENTDLKPDMCIFSGFDSNMSLTKWKEWLSQHPTEVYYELDTPQTIILPSIFPIELWQGTNIFKLITNLDTDFEVEYIVDKDSVLNEVQTAMLEAEI